MANKDYQPDDIRLYVINEMMENELNTNGDTRTYWLLFLLQAEEWKGGHGLIDHAATYPEIYQQISEAIDTEVKRRKALSQDND